MIDNYVLIHCHSDFSNGTTNIDSITKYKDYIARAKECGMKAFCFTEHGNVFSWLHKKEEIEKAGMKYIHGIEAYVTESLDEKVMDNYHCVLIAKNYQGVLEINQLSTNSYNRDDGHYYYKPRITFDELAATSDNIIITTACLGGILSKGTDSIKERFIQFLSNHKERCFLEIQHHRDEKGEQAKYNKYLYDLSKEIGVPLVAGTDTHALNDVHLDGRKILQKAKKISFPEEDSWDLTFKTFEQLVAAYKEQDAIPMDVVMEAIANTTRIADMVEEFTMDRSYKYPHLWENSEALLMSKIHDGIVQRGVDKYPNYQEYLDRIEEEMKAYRHNEAIDFMLLVEDIIHWCHENGIDVGYGRGSVNGSMVAWLLGITEMDSIKHKLNFQRFMNVERVSLSDIDVDYPPSRVNEVKDYIFSKHGLYCCDIITFNTIADKGAIRDVGRALEIPLDEVSGIAAAVDDEKEYEKVRKNYPELFKYVDIVKGVIVSVGSHPCGLVTAPHAVTDEIGCFTTTTSDYPISQLNMKEIDSLNYVKLDLLKSDTVELINETCKLAHIDRLTPDNMDINDKKVWDAIRDDTTQIFQWEGKTGNDYIKKLLSDENIEKFQTVNPKLDRMTLVSIGNSAIRPAGASYRDDLANGVVRSIGSKVIDDFLSDTFGYLVFQCQIIEFLHIYCGYTMGEADVVRRGFAKKTGTEQHIPRIRDGFIKTMTEKYGVSKEKAEHDILAFIRVIEDASNYLFSLNHSLPYSYEGYASGWLRTYYPLEFLTVALNINVDKPSKTAALTEYAKKNQIAIMHPAFRKSKAAYFFDADENSIYKGIGSLKYLNESVADALYALKNQKFDSFTDLLLMIRTSLNINARQLRSLIKIDFFKEFGNINKLMSVYSAFDSLYDKANRRFKKQLSKSRISAYNVKEDLVKKYAKSETDSNYRMVDVYGMLREMETYDFEDIDTMTKAMYQQTILNDVNIIDKNMKGVAVVCGIDERSSPTITSYALANGNTVEFRVPKQTYSKWDLCEGDVIRIKSYYPRPKQRWLGGHIYENIPGTKVLWVTAYNYLLKSELRGD